MTITLVQKLVAILAWLVVVLGLAAAVAGDDSSKKSTVQKSTVPKATVPSVPSRSASVVEPYFATNTAAHTATARLREGEKIADLIGEFQKSGDRFTFSVQESKTAIRVLENLSLERVARSLEDDPASRVWSASGVITEFRGENYLLLSRAVLKPRTTFPPRTPGTENNKKKKE